MSFRQNSDDANLKEQRANANSTLTTSAILFPVLAVLVALAAFLYDRYSPASGNATMTKRSSKLSIQSDGAQAAAAYKEFENDAEAQASQGQGQGQGQGKRGLSDFAEPAAGDREDGTVTRKRQEKLDALEEPNPNRGGGDDDADLQDVLERHSRERASLERRQQQEIAGILGT